MRTHTHDLLSPLPHTVEALDSGGFIVTVEGADAPAANQPMIEKNGTGLAWRVAGNALAGSVFLGAMLMLPWVLERLLSLA